VRTGSKLRLPNEPARCNYRPSVNELGTVFFGRSGFGCGLHARLVRYPIGGPPDRLLTFVPGRDLASGTYAVDNGDSTTDVYYDHSSCFGSPNIKKIIAAT
jgi:hypothetical protein